MNYGNFNAIVFTGDPGTGNKGFITYHKQNSVYRLMRYLNSKYPEWRFLTIYDRKTNEKEIIKRSNFLPSFQKKTPVNF
jgi:hypothetical protein